MALLTIGIAACSSVSTPPVPLLATPTQTPLRTVTPEPTITPTPDWALVKIQREQLAEQLIVEADAVATDARRLVGETRALDVVRHYVPVYLALACVESKEPSVKDFRLFTNNAIAKRTLVDRAALRVIRVILDAANSWRNQSLDTATQLCLQPYLYPESLTDAKPAIDLYLASSLPSLSPLAKGGFEAQVRGRAGGWFDQTDQQEPYISWLCGNDC